MASSRIVELATRISENTAIVDAYLRENQLPSPSFDEDGPVDFAIQGEEVKKAHEEAIALSWELHRLLLGPSHFLRPVPNGLSLQAISKHDIATKVPVHGKISYAALAQQCGLSEINTRRFVRYAIVHHRVFCEPQPGYVAHSAASRLLAEDPVMRDVLSHYLEECFPSFAMTLRAIDQFQDNGEPNQTGWNLYHETPDAPWDYYETHPAMARRFASTMAYETEREGRSSNVLVEGYAWTSLLAETTATTTSPLVVDVGGSRGKTALEIAHAHPELTLLVQDLPSMIEGARDQLPAIPARERVQFMAHDFFAPQLVPADAYILRHVFHNWSDRNAVRILRALVPSLRPGARLIVNDYIAPVPGVLSLAKEQRLREMDLIMLTLCNAYEREEQDWKRLFQEADPRFHVRTMSVPKGATEGILEVIWEG
ncbi:O-methyltransferas-like protein [Aspergillus japonicus CBS 114.51]|uniref:O-methyltransferas-like protein n=1 Tax=Aspergillus japonicus CBS 114.51 TaxID=1448312 RepID=A0A8T8X8K1_ASPJA|nr:O-methyltransferas-like protein [Aspergillus japonicus CBS 114.51]RAH84214.1 O-methyltransferas-like protein [Aspergillus japonicus CBS 114.51]